MGHLQIKTSLLIFTLAFGGAFALPIAGNSSVAYAQETPRSLEYENLRGVSNRSQQREIRRLERQAERQTRAANRKMEEFTRRENQAMQPYSAQGWAGQEGVGQGWMGQNNPDGTVSNPQQEEAPTPQVNQRYIPPRAIEREPPRLFGSP
ncbi:MAG: hypothetical protein ACK4VI_03010 [Alphaproteobacteria bacterium]